MKKIYLSIFIFCLCAFILTGCGPKTDTTDPLSGYDVDVNLPFATAQPGDSTYSLTTPEPAVLTGWNGETITIEQDAYAELQQGSIGTKVKNLQKRLIELGYMTGTASGTFDNATTLAVKRFESAYGQTQTGIASIIMQYYLYSETAKIYSGSTSDDASVTASETTYRTLQRGDSGADVEKLSQRLIDLGYMTGTALSYYDADLENGVKALESAYSQSRTGIATIELQKFLYSDSVKSAWQIAAEATAVPTATPTPAPWAYYNELSYGDSGNDVKNLQNRLRELGYMTSKADGQYGEKTVEAVKAFEAMYGKSQTGVATAQLQYYLYSDDALPAGTVTATPSTVKEAEYSMLTYGDYGDAVVLLQERLKELGYLDGNVDGYYGKQTQAAVSAFETANGAVSTGVATATLQQYLFSDNAQAANSTVEEVTTVYSELSLGSYGSDVSTLQQRLTELGYYTGTISGYFDENTENAVKAFEAAYGRTETGIATELLQTYLYSSSARMSTTASAASSYTSLKKGDKGDNVAKLQLRLIELGYLAGTVDGYYGDGTAEAVKAFEAAYGKTQTGVASAELQSWLYSENAIGNTSSEVAYSYSTLSSGNTGDAVTMLQNRLIELGYMTGSATGTYDSATVKAVKAFQKASGLTQTGTATSALQRELFSDSAVTSTTEDDKVVTVNKTAYVSVAETYVYESLSTDSAYSVISIGTEVTILKTKGIWAQIKNSKGNTGYALLENFTYTNPASSTASDTVVSVNKQAVVNVEKLVVFDTPSDAGNKLGTLSEGTYVTWLRTRGDWAEIQNSAGDVGYVHVSQITALSSADLPGGTDSQNSITAYTRLSYKSTGTAVKQLQARLKELGYFDGQTAGNYLDKTKAAVEAFEKAIGLTPTGVATVGLQDILYSSAAPAKGAYQASTQYTFSDLSYGETGDAVGEMQKQLVALGYLNTSGCTFATYDEATAMAVMDVQETMGLQDVNGIATRELQAFLLSNASEAIAK